MRDIEDYTSKYLKGSFEEYKVYYRRKRIIKDIERFKPKNIVEIGCGMEPIFKFLDNDCFESYVFFEPSDVFYQNAIGYARDRTGVTGIHDVFFHPREQIDLKVDFIICSSLLHELEQPLEMLKDIVSVCSESTVVEIIVPNANSLHRKLGVAMGIVQNASDLSQNNHDFQQHYVFDIDTIEEMVLKSGLQIVEIEDFFLKPFSHEQMYAMINKGIITEDTLEGLDKIGDYIPSGLGSEIRLLCKK